MTDPITISPHAIVSDAKIGQGTTIGAFSHVYGKSTFIGEYVKIIGHDFIPNHITIHDHCFIGPGVVFVDAKYPDTEGTKKTVVEDHVVIGAGSIIGAGVRIGRGSFIGMGSVVTKDVPRHVLAYGNPCHVWKKLHWEIQNEAGLTQPYRGAEEDRPIVKFKGD
jgi:acetyltransferase-like isoleucine patch superfamily enzyme